MSDQPKTFKLDKKLLLKLTLAVIVVVALVLVALHFAGVDVVSVGKEGLAWCKTNVNAVMDWTRELGPLVFFSAMAILPAFGFPLSPFTLSAGPVFVPQYGLGWVIVFVLVSIAANLALSYWLARYALRPLLAGLIKKFGYELPEMTKENGFNLAVIVRVTPGPPFFVQSYLLGLAEVAFKTYMLVSWVVSAMYAIAIVVFGDAILHGKGRNAFFSLLMIVGVVVGIKWLRKRALQKKAVSA